MAGAALAPVSALMDKEDEEAEEEFPALVYYYDPTYPYEPSSIDMRPGAINYLMYGRERVEPLIPGKRTPRVVYVENPDV